MIRTTLCVTRLIHLLIALALFSAGAVYAQKIHVHGLFKNSAVVSIDGKQAILKVGKPHSSGIKLISATSKKAIINVNGVNQTFSISRKNAAGYAKPTKNEVRLQAGRNNHFFAKGRVNGFSADFLVDTGASYLALNKNTAQRMGITKNQSLGDLYVNTANSRVKAYLVELKSVTVGSITVNNVRAVIMPNEHPKEILLGNSFLSKCNMKVAGGVLVLTSKI